MLSVCGVTKRFPGVTALRGVNLEVAEGEVVSLIGENGAGKSTLMKILAGVQQPDEGTVTLDGRRLDGSSVAEAQKRGMSLIHQELNLAENLTVGGNIFLGREPARFGFLDEKKIRLESQRFLAKVGLEVDPSVPLAELNLGRQQLVEIAKALSTEAKVIMMDEPTSSLSQRETEKLFEVIRDLKNEGVAVIYISHRLGEVREISDRVVVFRDGENAGELSQAEINHDAMVRLMVGREVTQLYQRKEHALGEVVLKVAGLRTRAYPEEEFGVELRAGEVVGVAGLVGAGRSEVLEAIFGMTPAEAGQVQGGLPRSPREAMDLGLAFVPEDRKGKGLVLDFTVEANTSLASLGAEARGPFLNRRREKDLCREMTAALSIKTPGPWQRARLLSGGNQQKIVLAKWLALTPRVLLLDEPTRGVDIGAKEEIYGLVERFAREGMGVLFVSSELEEVMGMADRVLVMREGRVTGELNRADFSEEAIMKLATQS
jgi:ribose transport system ATP-binding protein